jgi:hypothetical protein
VTTPDPNPIYTGLLAEQGLPGTSEPETATETSAETERPADGTTGTSTH